MSERSGNSEGYVHCVLPQHSVIDQQGMYLVAAGERGLGKLLTIKYVSPVADGGRPTKNLPDGQARQRGDAPTSGGSLAVSRRRTSSDAPCPIELNERGRFRVTDPITAEVNEENYTLQVELSVDLNIFLVAQQRGHVAIFSLDGCERLAFLNEPTRMQEISLEEEEDLGINREQQEKTAWTLPLTARLNGPNTHRAPNGEQMAGSRPLMATQRHGAPSKHMDSNSALPKA